MRHRRGATDRRPGSRPLVCRYSGLLIAASLFIGGAATLLQTIGLPFFGCQLPLVQGVSFASVATIVAIVGANGGEGGLPVVFGAVIGAAAIGLLITPIFSKITKFFPPLVTGIVITTIGLTPDAGRCTLGYGWQQQRGRLRQHGQYRPGSLHPGHRAAAEQGR